MPVSRMTEPTEDKMTDDRVERMRKEIYDLIADAHVNTYKHAKLVTSFVLKKIEEERESIIIIVDSEEELDGEPPIEISKDFRNVKLAVEHLRATVRATKQSIVAKIRERKCAYSSIWPNAWIRSIGRRVDLSERLSSSERGLIQ